MYTKYRVGDDVYFTDRDQQAVFRRRIVSLTITVSDVGAGGPYGLLSNLGETYYTLDGMAWRAREDELYATADEAFRSIK